MPGRLFLMFILTPELFIHADIKVRSHICLPALCIIEEFRRHNEKQQQWRLAPGSRTGPVIDLNQTPPEWEQKRGEVHIYGGERLEFRGCRGGGAGLSVRPWWLVPFDHGGPMSGAPADRSKGTSTQGSSDPDFLPRSVPKESRPPKSRGPAPHIL